MNTHIIFETERLCFGEWSPDDFEHFKALATNPHVMKYIGTGELWSDERIREFLDRNIALFDRRKFCLWPLYHKSTMEFVGFCGLAVLNEPDEIEIGWWLHPTYWGMGIATEAASRVVTYAFHDLNLPHIVSIAQPQNPRSIHIMEKIGMEFTKMSQDRHGNEIVYYVLKNAQ